MRVARGLGVLAGVLVVTGGACTGGGERVETKPARDDTSSTTSAAAGSGSSGRYEASTTVLESERHGPQLCLGGVQQSLPPQCGGPDVVGWDWAQVDGEESVNRTTWGDYHVVGTWDGERLTLTEKPGPPKQRRAEPRVDLSTPCEPPPGGWKVVDERTATESGQLEATRDARRQDDFGGAWVDQSVNADAEPGGERGWNDPTKLVLNVRFTGDLDRHEQEIRNVWGGSLCVSKAERSMAELERIRDELIQSSDDLGMLTLSTDETRGVVDLQVIVDDGVQERMDERYGKGTVDVSSAMRPVE